MIEMIHRLVVFRPVLLRLILIMGCLFATGERVQAGERSLFFPSQLRIITAQEKISVSIEIAATEQARFQGLQGRRYLAPDAGMLFDFVKPQNISMWMKNTYIPLDMLFISADGRILHIAENTEPFSLKTIAPPVPARAVLELKAGSAARWGVQTGHRIEHPIFMRK